MHVKGCPCEALFICCYCCCCPQQQGSDALLHYAYAKRGEFFFFFLASRLVRSKFFYHGFSIPLFDCIDLIVFFCGSSLPFFFSPYQILYSPFSSHASAWSALLALFPHNERKAAPRLLFFFFKIHHITSQKERNKKKQNKNNNNNTFASNNAHQRSSPLRRGWHGQSHYHDPQHRACRRLSALQHAAHAPPP